MFIGLLTQFMTYKNNLAFERKKRLQKNYPYNPAVAFHESALTLKWSKTTVTCSLGVATSVYVQLVCDG